MKKILYKAPSISVENMKVEKGYYVSEFGEYGAAGQQSSYLNFEDDL